MYLHLVSESLFRGIPFVIEQPGLLPSDLHPGCMVLLSGKKSSGRCWPGFVLAITEQTEEPCAAVDLVDILHGGRTLASNQLLALVQWMAGYYLCRSVDVLNAAIPTAVRSTIRDMVELNDDIMLSGQESVVSTPLRRAIMKTLYAEKKIPVRQLQQQLGKKELYRTLTELERGSYLRLSRQQSHGTPKKRTAYRYLPSKQHTTPIQPTLTTRQQEHLAALQTCFPDHMIAIKPDFSPVIMDNLVQKGLAEKILVTVSVLDQHQSTDDKHNQKKPTKAQQLLLEQLFTACEKKKYQTFLLHGVTGSGKTLIYIELLKKILAEGKNAIVLVPEIALTPQTASRFREHFGELISILHSAMSNREKHEAWHRLRSGKSKIALGARSTIFAPLENIGAIIVDEEHDGAYKQERNPRYHARDTAVMRARLANAICLLGSATPSFESYQNAKTGKYSLLELPDRVDGATMPQLRIIWMREAIKASASLSQPLIDQIRLRLNRNEQTILLQNRRGFAGSILCLSCGHTPHCPACNIPLVYHALRRQLTCHYCGYTEPFKPTCTQCSGEEILYKSSGTERIEEELQQLFPDEKILRMDVDTTGKKGAHEKILREFHEQKARILLGTQMVAKGLDFPAVTLVGILMADIGLNIPDFRASERIYSLLTQVSGRAGRASIPGEVYMQVYNKEHEVFDSMLHGSYEMFFQHEMKARTELCYPPASRLIKFEWSSSVESTAEQAAESCRQLLEAHLDHCKTTILGPAPAGIPKMRNRYRFHLLLKSTGSKPSPAFIAWMQESVTARVPAADLLLSIDVDPQNLL